MYRVRQENAENFLIILQVSFLPLLKMINKSHFNKKDSYITLKYQYQKLLDLFKRYRYNGTHCQTWYLTFWAKSWD
jgi:hypothetical protein